MEITQENLRIGDYAIEFSNTEPVGKKKEGVSWIIHESIINNEETKRKALRSSFDGENSFHPKELGVTESDLNSMQQESSTSNSSVLTESDYLSSLDREHFDDKLNEVRVTPVAEILIKSKDNAENIYNVQTVVVPSDILELSLSIKQEKEDFNCNLSSEDGQENSCEKLLRLIGKTRKKSSSNVTKRKTVRKEVKEKSLGRGSSRQRLRKQAEFMKEKRKKLYERESVEDRNERLAKEATKRRELRKYYETPEKRRKRLDNEAARKREHRMYNEAPDERRKRLDREAERRRLKRSNIYENETPEQRRERLNRESTKRRESRKNQYANETDKERRLRLEKDAIRAREMRFTRSAIESDEERRKRLVKDALRKRELRMHSGDDRVTNDSQIGSPMKFEEFNMEKMKKQLQDNPFDGHYLGNWMMWFQNTNQSDHKFENNSTEL